MRILLDTNVLLDYLMAREPFKLSAERILKSCAVGEVQAYVAAHSISNLFYILRKLYTIEERRDILSTLCEIIPVAGISNDMIKRALENREFSDFEDCLQMECAKEVEARFIVTRNLSDFRASVVEVISPDDFAEKYIM